MGYEVLDSRGESATGLADEGPLEAAPADVPVVDLGAPTEVDGRLTQSPPAVRGPRLLRAAGDRRTALLVALSLSVGGLVGGALNQRHSNLAAQAEDRTAFAVSAQASAVSAFALRIGVGARLQVEVSNLGPLPVDVVDSGTFGGRPGIRVPLVTMLGAGTSIAPGRSAKVEMRVSVDCRPGRTLAAKLPVRTADGIEHRLVVTMPDDGRPTKLCPRVAENSSLQADLAGNMQLPSLRLFNPTEQPLRVSLVPGGLSPDAANAVVQVVTRPVLPRTIGPNDQLTVGLRFVARSCVEDLQDLQRLDIASLTLAAQLLTPGAVVPAGQVEVDVTAVIAAAMVRSCG